MADIIEFDHESGTGFLGGAGAFVMTTGARGVSTADSNMPAVDSTIAIEKASTDSKPWSPWGPMNTHPQDVIALVSPSTVAPAALSFKVKAIYGKGVKPVLVDINEDGTEKISAVTDPKVLDFFRVNKMQKLMLELITDYVWFANAFPEIILNKKKNRIVRMYVNDAACCRLGKRNFKTGYIEKCYVSGNWPSPKVSELSSVDLLDPYDGLYQLAEAKSYKYVVPVSTPSPGKTYYQLAMWDGARSNGWIEIANQIPLFKKAMFKNQMSIKYLIKIPYEYWQKLVEEAGLKVGSPDAKALITAKLQEVNDFLTKPENTGKAFVSHFGTDPLTKKEIAGWQIEAVDDKFKDGKWLPDSAAANSEILFSMHVDPSIFGAGMPGGVYSGSSGSGSDKRESFLIQTALLQSDRDAIVEPLNIIRDFNGWDSRIQFRFEDTILTTLDTGSGTKKVLS